MPDAHSASADCICKLCDCVKHRCGKPALPSYALDDNTEYIERFKKHPVIYGGPIKPKSQPVASSEPMSNSTENRERYKEHVITRKLAIPRPEYVPNKARLDSETGYAHDFQAWKVDPRKPIKKSEEWKQSNNEFYGSTTSAADYQRWTVLPRWQRPKQVYQPNPAKLDPTSSYTQDFQNVPVCPRKQHVAEAFKSTPDDRSFDSTMRTAFVGFTGPRPRRREIAYVAPNTKFDGNTTTGSDYIQQKIERRQPCIPIPTVQPSAKLDDSTEYSSIYTGKTTPRYFHPAVEYHPSTALFEGQSTMQADYKGFGNVKREQNFAPRVAYTNEHDDRSWTTETRDKHCQKSVPICASVRRCIEMEKLGQKPQMGKDGHIYFSSVQPTIV